MRLSTLKKQAQLATHWRGHQMRWIKPGPAFLGYRAQTGVCRKCEMTVHLREHPAPNQIDIGGEAVALNCKVQS